MAVSTVPTISDELLSTTFQNMRTKMENEILLQIPTLFWLFEKGRKKVEDGGTLITIPLLYGKNTTVGSYSGYDTIDTTPQAGMTNAYFQWRNISLPVCIWVEGCYGI